MPTTLPELINERCEVFNGEARKTETTRYRESGQPVDNGYGSANVQQTLGNSEHIGVVKHGLAAIRKWREAHPRVTLDLRGANFQGIKLTGVDLSGAKFGAATPDENPANLRSAGLRNAQLRGSYMRMVDLRNADLRGANLFGSQLSIVDFGFADLRGANLRDCIFIATDFHGAELAGASIAGSIIGHTRFTALDLSKVQGISDLRHEYPSFIGVETLLRSRQLLPEIFLRGCGVPDALIAILPQLSKSMDPIQFNSCFISFSYSDNAFATRLHSHLGDAGVRAWFSPKDMRGGRRLFDQIDRAIQEHDLLLLILSEKSMKSDWVATEIRKALTVEMKTKQRKLFPIRLCGMESLKAWTCFDADTGKDMAVQIREYFIPDFSEWKNHTSFEDGVSRLLRDLRSTV